MSKKRLKFLQAGLAAWLSRIEEEAQHATDMIKDLDQELNDTFEEEKTMDEKTPKCPNCKSTETEYNPEQNDEETDFDFHCLHCDILFDVEKSISKEPVFCDECNNSFWNGIAGNGYCCRKSKQRQSFFSRDHFVYQSCTSMNPKGKCKLFEPKGENREQAK